MKRYKLVVNHGYTVEIINQDEHRIIESIRCVVVAQGFKQVHINFVHETKEMKDRFKKVQGIQNLVLGYESVVNRAVDNVDRILEFFKIIQDIDPVPLNVLGEMKALIDMDLTVLLNHGLMKQMLMEGNHEGALQMALASNQAGNMEALPFLADWYEKNPSPILAYASGESKDSSDSLEEDESILVAAADVSHPNGHLLNILEHYPKTHPSFVSANEKAHEILMQNEISSNKKESLRGLEKKFRTVLNSEQAEVAAHYFDQLCGNSGINPKIKQIMGNPDTLIQLARNHREERRELEELRAYKASQSVTAIRNERALGPEPLGVTDLRGLFKFW